MTLIILIFAVNKSHSDDRFLKHGVSTPCVCELISSYSMGFQPHALVNSMGFNPMR